MESRTTILNELKEISSVVAAIGHQNPYTVPAGYFEGLAQQLLLQVQAEEEPVLPRANQPFEVPQGYFEGLAEQLLNRVKGTEASLSEALQQAKTNPYQAPQGYFEALPDQLLQSAKANLAQANNNPYKVPQGYFESLPATILNRIKADSAANADEELEMLSPLLKQIGKKNPFSTPEGYFTELTDNTMAGARAIDFVNSELEHSSPLQGLQQKQVYEIPQNYFEQLPTLLLQKVQPRGKVVSMRRRFLQYAAAAVVAGLLLAAGWMYLGGTKTTDNGTAIPPVIANKLDKVSDEVLENYIENEALIPVEAPVTASNEIDMKEMLADVSDEDLQLYLEKYNTSKDILTN